MCNHITTEISYQQFTYCNVFPQQLSNVYVILICLAVMRSPCRQVHTYLNYFTPGTMRSMSPSPFHDLHNFKVDYPEDNFVGFCTVNCYTVCIETQGYNYCGCKSRATLTFRHIVNISYI